MEAKNKKIQKELAKLGVTRLDFKRLLQLFSSLMKATRLIVSNEDMVQNAYNL